jgi:hypothetical protein
MKFTLKCEHFDYDIYSGNELDVNNIVTHEFRGESLSSILENFESFLRGNGFHFEGNLDIVNDEYTEKCCSSENCLYQSFQDNNDNLDYDHPEANFDYDESESLSMCPVCKIDNNIMKNHTCFDKNCPKGK